MSVTCISFVCLWSYSVLDDGDVVSGFMCVLFSGDARLDCDGYRLILTVDCVTLIWRLLLRKDYFGVGFRKEEINGPLKTDYRPVNGKQWLRVSGFRTVEIVLEGWLRLFPRRFRLRVESELLCWSKSLGSNWWFFFHSRNFDSTHRLNVDYELLKLSLHTSRRRSGMFRVRVDLSEFGGRVFPKTIQCKNDGWCPKGIGVDLWTKSILVIWSSLLPGHASTSKIGNFPS